jgi:transposase
MDALAAGNNAAVQMKIHAVVDSNGLSVHLALTPGEVHDNRLCRFLAHCFRKRCCSHIADTTRTGLGNSPRQQGSWANTPKRNRKDPICFSPYLYRARNPIERFFNKIKQCRRVATR